MRNDLATRHPGVCGGEGHLLGELEALYPQEESLMVECQGQAGLFPLAEGGGCYSRVLRKWAWERAS